MCKNQQCLDKLMKGGPVPSNYPGVNSFYVYFF
jgi:hypothetical protein